MLPPLLAGTVQLLPPKPSRHSQTDKNQTNPPILPTTIRPSNRNPKPSHIIQSSMAEASLEPNSELLAGTGLEGHVRFGPAGFEDLMGTTLSLRHSLPAPPFCLWAVMRVARPTADQEPCPVLFFLSSTVSDKCPEGLEVVCRFQCCVPSTCDSTADEACVPVRACVCTRVWVPRGKMPPSSLAELGLTERKPSLGRNGDYKGFVGHLGVTSSEQSTGTSSRAWHFTVRPRPRPRTALC